MAVAEPNWLPIESNPEVMNAYAAKLGLNTSTYAFIDVLSTEDWALAMVPSPVVAVLLLFPIKEASEKHRAEEDAQIKQAGQAVDPRLYFTLQTVGNACGTIGLLHAVVNASTLTGGELDLPADSWFHRWMTNPASGRDATPEQRAKALESNTELEAEHSASVQQGSSAVVEDTYNHFICFVAKGGALYELDGRKSFPVNHGPCADLLTDAVRVVRGFMARDPDEVRFTMVALAAPAPEEE